MSDVFVLPHLETKKIVEIVEGNVDFSNQIKNQGILKSDGSQEMTGNLNLGTNKIINVGLPTENTDAATKEYVDSKYSGGGSNVDSGSTFSGDMKGAKITNLGAPTATTDASTKQYVDDKVTNISFPKFSGNMEGAKITNLGAPTVDTDAATRKFVVDSVFKGDAVGNRIVNIGDPVNASDAANKRYVDSKAIPADKFDVLNSNLLDVPVKTGLSVAYDSVNVELTNGSVSQVKDLVGDINMNPQSGFSSTYNNSGKIPYITCNRSYYLKHNPVDASKYVDTDSKSETWFYVAKLSDAGFSTMFWWGNGTIRHSTYYEPSNKRFKIHHGNISQKEIFIPYIMDFSKTHVFCFQRNGDNLKMYVDGVVIHTDVSTLTVTGSGQGELLQFYGDFYAFMVYNKGLSDSDCDLINDFLIKKYVQLEDETKNYYTLDRRVDMNGFRLSNVADPANDLDVVTKKYVDGRLLFTEQQDVGFYEESPVKTGVFACYTATNVKLENKKVVAFKDLGSRGYDLVPNDKTILPDHVESAGDQAHTYALFTNTLNESFVYHNVSHLGGTNGNTTSVFMAVKFNQPENTLSTLLNWEDVDRDGKINSSIGMHIWNTYFSGSNKQFVVKHGSSTVTYDQPSGFDYSKIHVVGFVRNLTSIKMYIDKQMVKEVNDASGTSIGFYDLVMFKSFAGQFYGGIIYDRALSLAETDSINEYIFDRYVNHVVNQKEISTLDTLNVTNSLTLKGDPVATEIYARDYVRTYGETIKFTGDMKEEKIINLGLPTSNTDAATKAYVDSKVFDGDMKNQNIINLRVPQNPNDAVNKYYVDYLVRKESILDGIPFTSPYIAYDANHTYAPTGKVDRLLDISKHGRNLDSKYDPHPDLITDTVSDYILFEDNDALVDYGFKNPAGDVGNTVTWFYSCVLKSPHPPEATLFYIGDEPSLINGTAGSHMSLKVINGSSVKVTMGTNVFTANFPVSYTDGDVCVFAYYRNGAKSVLYFNGVKIGELTNNSDNYLVSNDAFLIGFKSNIRFYSMVLYDKVLPVSDILKTSTYFLDRYETNSVPDAIHEVFGDVSINGELRVQDIAIKPTYEEIVTYRLGSINADTVKEHEFFFYKKSANRIRPISLYLTGIFHDSNFKFTTSSFVQLDVLAIVEGETIATPPILSIGEEATNSSKDLTKYFSYSNSTSIFYGRSDISQTRLDYFFKIHKANTNIGLKITILKNELRKIAQTNSVDYDTANIYLEVAEERVRNQYF